MMERTPCRLCVSTYLDGPAHDHDGIVQRAFRLLHELLSPAPQDDGTCLGLGAALEEVVPEHMHSHVLPS